MDINSQAIENVNVNEIEPLKSPLSIKKEIGLTASEVNLVKQSREVVSNILAGKDSRQLVIAGPCSVHDEASILEYAEKLVGLHEKYKEKLYIIIRYLWHY